MKPNFFTSTIKQQNIPKLVIFDMDNTIAYREHHFSSAMKSTLEHFFPSTSVTAENLHDTFFGKSINQCWEYIENHFLNAEKNSSHLPISAVQKKYFAEVKKRDTAAAKENKLFMTDCMNIMQSLHNNHIAICIVSGSSRIEIEHIINLGKLPITQYWGAEDYAPYSKPSPEPYLRAFNFFQKQLHMKGVALEKKDVIILEDSMAGTISATAAGIRCIVRPHDKPQGKRIGQRCPNAKIVNTFSICDLHPQRPKPLPSPISRWHSIASGVVKSDADKSGHTPFPTVPITAVRPTKVPLQ